MPIPPAHVADSPLELELGLLPGTSFALATGEEAPGALPQAAWYFRGETIAVPRDGVPVAGFARGARLVEDIAAWAAATPPGSARDAPPLVWIGSPAIVHAEGLTHTGRALATARGPLPFALHPRLASNRAYYDETTAAWLAGRALRVRGTPEAQRFVVRTLWPAEFRLPVDAPARAAPARAHDGARPLDEATAGIDPRAATLRALVRAAPDGGARQPFDTATIWRRHADAPAIRAGRPVLALVLNGAQGDDDEAHGGHFAIAVGRVGPSGEMHDWLVANFYPLDSESEKGILAAMVPLDNYLADLNSGQAWYRPSYLLVATLREERAALQVQSAFGRAFNLFYRHLFHYHHARANCTGICIDVLRALGLPVRRRAPGRWLRAALALPVVAVRSRSLARARAAVDYLTEDLARLLPAAAFEEAGAALLRLADGAQQGPLAPLARALAEDMEELAFVRIPQLPSSRVWGTWPVASTAEYERRLPKDPAQHKIIPVGPRPFPEHFVDPDAPREPALRSTWALVAWAGVLLATFGTLGLLTRTLLR